MSISVNGTELVDTAIALELPHHQHAANPLKQAVHELVLRAVLLQEAQRLGVTADGDDATIEALFAREISVPEADNESCATVFRNHPEHFLRGELVEVRHILFQVTPDVPIELLRETGDAVLAALQENPDRFAELARDYSNCASGQVGGSLGQVGRGQTVAEFDDLIFRLPAGTLSARLLETRFGLHIVQVLRRVAGECIPFEAVRAQIAAQLSRQASTRAVHQYLQILVGRADIRGVTLEGANSALVQ